MLKLKQVITRCVWCMRVVVCELERYMGRRGIVNYEAGDQNAPTDEWIDREIGRAGERREKAECRENKTAAKAEESKGS